MGTASLTLRECTRCPLLVKTRSCIVNGSGPLTAKIAFVGEGPGQTEDEKRRPFVGKAGRVQKGIEWAAGINSMLSFHTNATRCWGKRNPKPKEVDACHDYLIEELRQVNPDVIVALGGPAIRSLYRKGLTVGEVMGFTVYNPELPGIPIIPTYHPSYIMRGNWDEVALVLAHFRKAKRIAEHGLDEHLGSYKGIETLEELRALRNYLLGPDAELIAIDTETTGLSWMDSELLCISFSGEPEVGYSVPILHRVAATKTVMKGRGKGRAEIQEPDWAADLYWESAELPEVLAILDEILASDKPKAGQNIGFDLRMLERRSDEPACTVRTALGFHVNNVEHDSRMLSSLLSEVSPANLTTLVAYWTDMPYYEQDIAPFKKKMWHLPDEKTWEYGGADVDAVQRLVPVLYPRVQDEGTDWVYHNISIPLIRCATKLEERGVAIDMDYFDRLCAYYKDKLAFEKEHLNEVVGHEVEHPTHYQHTQRLLFEELGLPLTRWATEGALNECETCKKDNPCKAEHTATTAEALAELNQRAPHQALPILIDIRHIEKFYSTYLEGGGGGFRRHIRADGRIHARWNAARAETGRFTCEEPNLMNPPREESVHAPEYGIDSEDAMRSMFTAAPGCLLMNADWSQLEVWVLGYETHDPTLMDLLLSGRDVHVYVGRKLCELNVSRIFPHEAWEPELSDDEWKTRHPDLRNKAKTFTFGLMYQLTEQGAADRLGCSLEEAHVLFQAFLNQVFPTLPYYFVNIRDEVLQNGSVHNRFGRRRHFEEVRILAALRYRSDLEGVIRQGVNFPIQSGGHDLHSLAHIFQERESSHLAWPVLEMHDSLSMEVYEGQELEAALALREGWGRVARETILPNGERLGWEIPVDIRWGRSLGELNYTLTSAGQAAKIENGA